VNILEKDQHSYWFIQNAMLPGAMLRRETDNSLRLRHNSARISNGLVWLSGFENSKNSKNIS